MALNLLFALLADAGTSMSSSTKTVRSSKISVSIAVAFFFSLLITTLAAGWTTFFYSTPLHPLLLVLLIDFYVALKGSVKVGEDKTAIDPFYTVVLTADEKESGVLLTGTKGSELVLVR